jgi:hypothetical protein
MMRTSVFGDGCNVLLILMISMIPIILIVFVN